MKKSLMVASIALLSIGCATRPSSHAPRYGGGPIGPTMTQAPPVMAGQSPHVGSQFGVAYVYLPGNTAPMSVHYENVNGMAVYEGDILLGPAHQVQANYAMPRFASSNVSYATSTRNKSHLWPGAIIPYEVDSSVTPQERANVEWAVAHVSSQSVLKLRPRTAADTAYVVFTEQGGDFGCNSYVGRSGGKQEIQVSGCSNGGSVVHEIGHAAGFYHEQQRTDRDAYITVAWDEISPGHEEWFKVKSNANDIGQYDYGSIMHYSRKAFSKSGRDTIIPKDPNARVGQREGFSALDKVALVQLYGGADVTASIPLPPWIAPGTVPTTLPSIPGLPPLAIPQELPPIPAMPGLPPWVRLP